MRIRAFAAVVGAVFFFDLGLYGAFAIGEEKLELGARAGWRFIEREQDITETSGVRPYPVLALLPTPEQSGQGRIVNAGFWGERAVEPEVTVDLALGFNEKDSSLFGDAAGNYVVTAGADVSVTRPAWARHGTGAAFFPGHTLEERAGGGASQVRIHAKTKNALFYGGRNLDDFSIEFWIYPVTMESGEHILVWSAALPASGPQHIICKVSKNRLHWTYDNFFTSADNKESLNVTLSSKSSVLPKVWSQHLVRFNATSGLLEYYVNGQIEDTVYTTRSGQEHGEIYTPLAGERGSLVLGGRFNGLIDEFFIKEGGNAEPAAQGKYQSRGGVFRTRPLKVGEWESDILKINAQGGKMKSLGKKMEVSYIRDGRFRFDDDSEIQFFVRTADSPQSINSSRWIAFAPGAPLEGFRGRYIQIMGNFYPSGDNESSPFLESLEIVYLPQAAPPPPVNLVAVAQDGAVELRWKAGQAENLGGYMVYYGSKSGEYLGQGAFQGDSPVDAGMHTVVRIDNLKNGSLYYFSVSAYDKAGPSHVGDFSKEVTARPLRMESYD
ncbi:MAG: hypothetical protein LBC72_05230 [Spirochaetaceae bacterium]|jgi:hypothetical protein|nr:hypothetical protein [Spirochaetaceae bacterium]